MSKRLQVVLGDADFRDLQRRARRQGMTVSDWVRRALDLMRQTESAQDPGVKLHAVRESASYGYPSGAIGEMLADIERGYSGD